MTPTEVGRRGVVAVRHRADDASWRLARPLWRRAWQPPLASPDVAGPLGFLTPARVEHVLAADPAGCAGLVERAEALLEGRFAFFGYEEARLRRPLDYSFDALRDVRWPAAHAKRIDYRASGTDPKWIWELNRCQHVTVLAAAWLLTGREEFARCAADDIVGWIRASPPGRGIAWANGFEPALRGIAFAVVADALRGSAILGDEERRLVSLSLWQHRRWIQRDPSLDSSANNHRLAELVALLAIAVLAPELPESARWRSVALYGLEAESERQILADGGNPEQAFTYSVFVCDLLLLAAALLRLTEPARSALIDAALARAAAAFVAQMSQDEPAPRYGDNGEDRAIVLDGEDVRDPRGPCAGITALTGSSEALLVAGGLDATAAWLFGEDGARRFAATAPAAVPASCRLRDTGLVIFRRGPARALFDVGPLGYLSLAAHGHADALQVTYSDADGELVSDPGVGSYFRQPTWRAAFRGTGFHATIEVDGLDQSLAGGPFLWARHARVTVHQVDLGSGFALAEHDGYAALDDPVRHLRAVALLPDGALLVYDRLTATDVHRVRQCWPLHPTLDASVAGEHAVRVTSAGRPRALFVAAGTPGRVTIATGESAPFRGWWSPRLESVLPAPHVAVEVEQAGLVELVMLLTPASEGWPTPQMRLVAEGAIEAATGGCVCHARLDFGEPPRMIDFEVTSA
jgi:uncharacterized heparinase superfamily protein